MAQKLTKSDTNTKLIYKVLLRFEILENIAFKITEKIAKTKKVKKKEKERKKKYL